MDRVAKWVFYDWNGNILDGYVKATTKEEAMMKASLAWRNVNIQSGQKALYL